MQPQDTTPLEEWRPVPVPEFAALYDISSLGRIRRHNRTPGIRPWKFLRPYPQWHGYLLIKIQAHGVKRAFTVHRLVAGAFIGPCPDGYEVNHIDGDKTNNCPDNLEYVTRRENLAHADRCGLTRRGMQNGKARLTDADVRAIRASTETQTALARRYGVTQTAIWSVLHGRCWRHVT